MEISLQKRWLLLGLIVSAVAASAAEAVSEPTKTVEAFHAALAAGDKEGALVQLAEGVVIFESGGAEMSRAEYASHHMDGDMEFVKATRREIQDQSETLSGEIAWVLTRSKTSGSYNERDIDSRGVETMVLKKSDAGWRIVHIHWSSRNANR